MLEGFQETELFAMGHSMEYEANVFAADLLIDDKELLDMLGDENASFYSVARELYVPAALLDFKFRALKRKGYHFEAPVTSTGDFLKDDVYGCFEQD
jgi:Zn-dependent peptidase ImmA (M78 family)